MASSSAMTARIARDREFTADAVLHVLGLALGLPAALAVVVVAGLSGNPSRLAPASVYALGVIAMFGCSAAYNMLRASRRRDWLRRFDHAAIFAMIAGTYTPFTLRLTPGWAEGLTAAIWTMAGLGIAAKLLRPSGGGWISVALYLGLGWIGLVALDPFLASLAAPTLWLLAIGGILYTVGVVFHLWQKLPYQNALWHGFVLAAASVHYVAVLSTLDA